MAGRCEGEVALVTGASRGLGKGIDSSGIAVNAAAPWKPVATPGAGALDLAKEDTEDIDLITETALILCTGDPATLPGRIAYTQPFLEEVGRPG